MKINFTKWKDKKRGKSEMRKRKMSVVSQVTIGILSVVLAIYLGVICYFGGAIHPFTSSRSQAIEIAKSHTDLKTPEAFGTATTNETTYSVIGLDKTGKEIGVIIPKNSSKLTVVELSKGISPEKLKEKDTTSIVLGLYHNQTIWEVNNASDFKIYDFKTGQQLM
ncbi:hypothetical protein RT41_GL001297 [Lactococcus fujiensis JCM 16395]|uniref:Cell wall elongation regulator TseB-like domain-containing protein n=2 Tax=Lactococcus fujiensis TaxID=610251 RepID=A0A2A5RMB5_9LACT|nr:hypothetical protein RT41_GL001297 [Lactococcus fujiensis JCM 16395]